MKVVKVDKSIASISLFRINVPSSSESIRLNSELAKIKANNKVKLKEIHRLSHLLMNKNFIDQKIFEALIIYDNIDGKCRTF